MAENKTRATDASVLTFIDSIEHKQRSADALVLLDIFTEVTQQKAVMWGESIIGFGAYTYQTADGKKHQSLRAGFSPRKQNLALYIMVGFSSLEAKLLGLGKFKTGKSCLYINKLSDVDQGVLRDIIELSFDEMATKYPQ
ncbi:DUF1801 domain-containing protein [Paraglaciecola sp. 2405UD69-4]|uniref:DUF1801 domain-containing protein n=1 Tax=Paraglaciecola sp. 2405UD69-4 TaxID=3391836 RepID=UPI0039C9E422